MSKQAEFAVILKMNPMFADLGADELQRISGLCHTQQLGVGEMLFQKGDAGDALFGVRRGQVRIETGASDGSRLTLNFMGPGDLFGERYSLRAIIVSRVRFCSRMRPRCRSRMPSLRQD